jgi:ribose transport system ATP-binding protein
LISLEVGRELKQYYPKRSGELKDIVLEVQNITGNGVENISFSVHKGEILGVAGLVGSGRTEMAHVVYGAVRKVGGKVYIDQKKVDIRSPAEAIKHGIGLIPEDRKLHGCILSADVRFNISLSIFNQLARWLVMDLKKYEQTARYYIEKLNIRTPSPQQQVKNLSGGNQQKVVLAKTLAADTRILIFDEPTRGIDVGAKQEIYNLMIDLVNQGKSIVMISSEMEELLGMSDRLIVLHEGQLMGEITQDQFNQRNIIDLASGHQ